MRQKKNKDKQPKAKGKANQIKERALVKAIAVDKGEIDPYATSLIYVPDVKTGLYTPEILPRIEELARKGLTNRDIAKALGIGERTFYEWREKYPAIWHSIKKYRGLADIEVENALYKSAVGYKVTEVKRERRKITDPDTGAVSYQLVTTEELDKELAGSPTAQIFYLKNRMPERYRDKVETQISLAQDISQLAFAIKRREE